MRRMETNSKRIIVLDESSNSEAESEVENERTESETTESEWAETVNMAMQRRVGTNRREDDPRYIGEPYGNRE
jgi:hypothetical protein